MDSSERETCEEFVRALPDFLDDRASPAEEARHRAHLDTCERCFRKYRFERSLIDAIRSRLQTAALPVDFQRRLLAVLAMDDDGRRE